MVSLPVRNPTVSWTKGGSGLKEIFSNPYVSRVGILEGRCVLVGFLYGVRVPEMHLNPRNMKKRNDYALKRRLTYIAVLTEVGYHAAAVDGLLKPE